MRYALIEDNRVKDIFVEPEGCCIEECFHKDIASSYIPCPDDNIIEGDYYNPETQEFSEDPNKKLPNYVEWFTSLENKSNEIINYFIGLDSIILNNIRMYSSKIEEYEKTLSDSIKSQTQIEFELDMSILDTSDTNLLDKIIAENEGSNNPKIKFSTDEFQIMLDTLKNYNDEKLNTYKFHINSVKELSDARSIDMYDISTGWPKL